MGGEHERDRAMLSERAQPTQQITMFPDLRVVTAPEFLPAVGIMAEPFPQCGTRRDVFHPFIDRSIGFSNATRP
jgi:hypothetical protein